MSMYSTRHAEVYGSEGVQGTVPDQLTVREQVRACVGCILIYTNQQAFLRRTEAFTKIWPIETRLRQGPFNIGPSTSIVHPTIRGVGTPN